jgi:carbamoyl-phosphate synthase large subunit
MSTVLLSGAGGSGGVASIKILQKTTNHSIIAVDMSPKSAGFYFADHSEVVPAATSSDWSSAMEKVIKKYEVDVYLPLIDEELPRLGELQTKVPDSVGIGAPSSDFIEMATDKWAMTQSFENYGFAVPDTVLGSNVGEVTEDDFPLLIKPRKGRGSEGIQFVESADKISEYLRDSKYEPKELILQEFIDGTEFTTSVIGTKENELLGVVPKEVISRPEGNTVHGVTRANEQIIAECEDIFDAYNPSGPFNIQHMRADGSIYAFEINPRFSSTACLTVESGANELDLTIRNCLNEAIPESVDFEANLHILRYTDQIIGSKEEIFGEETEIR